MKKYIIRELFYFLTVLLVALVGLEFFWKGVVLSLFNINWILLAWVLNVIILLVQKEDSV